MVSPTTPTYMAFLYDADKLAKAGIAAPPATWDELVEQSLKIKNAGLSPYPLMLSMACEIKAFGASHV